MSDHVPQDLWIRGGRCAFGPQNATRAALRISGSNIADIRVHPQSWQVIGTEDSLDMSGYLLLPGLINAHDHLQFALFPRLGEGPYQNYIDWGEDIHRRFGDVIATQRAVPRPVRLWWGGIRNLLSGVTTVCHHDPLWPELQDPYFPVNVVQHYGWAHSVALGGDLRTARAATPPACAFIVHGCEGRDTLARNELDELKRLGLLDSSLVIVHGLALDDAGIADLNSHGSSIIVCPSSNEFLFNKLPERKLLYGMRRIALGNDSPLTAAGDLLDEIRVAANACSISPKALYSMVTRGAAEILRLKSGEGAITLGGSADIIAVRDTGIDPMERLLTMSMRDVEFVMVRGGVQVASQAVWKQLSAATRQGMQPLSVGGVFRWVRAPIEALLREAEDVLGADQLELGGRHLRAVVRAD